MSLQEFGVSEGVLQKEMGFVESIFACCIAEWDLLNLIFSLKWIWESEAVISI